MVHPLLRLIALLVWFSLQQHLTHVLQLTYQPVALFYLPILFILVLVLALVYLAVGGSYKLEQVGVARCPLLLTDLLVVWHL